MNVPYVKEFDKNGSVENPIIGSYITSGENRRSRRMKEARFQNNRKTYQLQVIGIRKFRKILQRFYRKDGTIGIVKHYLS